MEPAVRTPGITSMLKNRKMKEAQRKRDEFVDRGVGTLLDGYTEEELLRCRKRHTAPQWASYHRTVLDLLWGQALVLRGESFRKAELCDLFTLPIKNQGATACPSLVLIMDNGKTNPFGKLQYNAAIRHKNHLLC
ncbi:hypothetical protein K402DRAFT_334169, partial [Aulographum hederae CBS 113979]